jgi:hypothetical protein
MIDVVGVWLLLQSALLNEAYELLLRYFSLHSSAIGFPELAYPSVVRVTAMLWLLSLCASV